MSEARGQTTMGLVELLLKQPAGVDELNRQPRRQREMFPRFVLIGETGFVIYAVVMVLVLNLAPSAALTHRPLLPLPSASWEDGSGLGLILAYTLGVLLAACVCLPSFYFYSLLAGVRITWLQITSLVGKGTAANAILLLGILPIYVAVALGLVIFEARVETLELAVNIGLALPFVTGFWGLWSIYTGIVAISENSPYQGQCPRHCFLRRLIFSGAAVYAAVVPVMIYRLWGLFVDALSA
ncbi:MAG TPA: hypothetical protein VNX28_02350 [Gemmataceae bacterium]|nr:hypothetical protein [Gemmataceae bacterium]